MTDAAGEAVLRPPAAQLDLPPCPTCGDAVENLEGFGERMFAWPCGHPVSAIVGAGGVTGAIILRPRASELV